MQICYPSSAVRFSPVSGAWMLDAGFDLATMALQLERTGPGGVAVLRDAQGRERARGPMFAEAPLWLRCGDGGVTEIETVEVGAVSVLISAEPLDPGRSYLPAPKAAQAGLRQTARELCDLAALGAGAMVATDEGALPVEWLRAGDRLLTRDNGFRPLISVARVEFADPFAEAIPICIPADAFGAHKPQRPMLATPALRVLLAAPELHTLFGESEMLARSDALSAAFGLAAGGAGGAAPRLFVLICATQEVILADGLWLETTEVNAALMAALDPAIRATLGLRDTASARAVLGAGDVAMFAPCAIAKGRRVAA